MMEQKEGIAMYCSQCKKDVTNQMHYQDSITKEVICESCFQSLDEEWDNDVVICTICQRQLDDNEEYLEEDQTGDCYCMTCFENNKDAILAQSKKYQ